MPSRTGRRSRGNDPDDTDGDSTREGTPLSTAPDDRKRARRSGNDVQTQTPSRPEASIPSTSRPSTQHRRNPPPQSQPLPNGTQPLGSTHHPGSIVRVKLTNFVTYTSAEFFPGPGLNMVIGPNGTGKSTLVCAICLGLGYPPSVLGRAKEPSEFVKHGCREAVIEIELARASSGTHRSRHNPVITRTIRRDGNKSSYALRGSSTTLTMVRELAKHFNIQVDNLCQFLPQDKVVEFAAMTSVELLKSTLEAGARPEMQTWHEELKELRKTQVATQWRQRDGAEQLRNLQGKQDSSRVDVERMRERVQTQKHLGYLEQVRPVALVAETKQKAREAKELETRLGLELKMLKKETAPALRKLNGKRDYLARVNELKKEREKALKDATRVCDGIDKEEERVKKTIDECNGLIEVEKRSRQPKRQAVITCQQEVTKVQNRLAQPEPEHNVTALNEQIKQQVAIRRQRADQISQLETQIADLRRQGKDRQVKEANLKKANEALETKSGQQFRKLERMYPNTAAAWTWITENRDKFEKEVFGPPLISCSLKDSTLAHLIESLLRDTDFKMITFQTQRDFETMRKQLQTMRLHDVSLRTCSTDTLDNFRPPLSTQALHDLGLETWAVDSLEGPANVLAMLCEKGLHQSAISRAAITDAMYEKIVKSGLTSFVAGTTSYTVTRRKEYGTAGESTRTLEVRPARVWNDSRSADMANEKSRNSREIGELNIEIQDLHGELKRCLGECAAFRSELNEAEREEERVKEEKNEVQERVGQWRALPNMLRMAEEKLGRAREDVDGIKRRIAEHEDKVTEALLRKADIALRYVAAVADIRTMTEQVLEVAMFQIEAMSDFESLEARSKEITTLLQTKGGEERLAREAARTEADRYRALFLQVQTLLKKATETEEQTGDGGLLALIKEFIANPPSEVELEGMVESDKARLDLIQGINGDVVGQFEERARRIEGLRADVEKSVAELEEVGGKVDRVRGQWEPELMRLVGKISRKFGQSFERIGCAGEVGVFKASSRGGVGGDDGDENNHNALDDTNQDQLDGEGGDSLDFANWAIHIRVKFRAEEPLSLLDAHRQSGGERAVSTIFYLMALQSLSRAPFRVVDEINQGMDPRNERMVHGRMVELCEPDNDISNSEDDEDVGTTERGKGYQSQYFLITPKLLSGLKYKRGMTVLCIASGEHMPPAVDEDGQDEVEGQGQETEVKKQWRMDLGAFVKRAKMLNVRGIGGAPEFKNGMRLASGVQRGRHTGANGVAGGTGAVGISFDSETVDGSVVDGGEDVDGDRGDASRLRFSATASPGLIVGA